MNSMLSYVLVAVLSVSLAVLFMPREWSLNVGNDSTIEPTVRLLSRRELSLYDGEEGSRGIYLAILGQVFDVHRGHKHYGPGGAYHVMAGDSPLLLLAMTMLLKSPSLLFQLYILSFTVQYDVCAKFSHSSAESVPVLIGNLNFKGLGV